MFKIRTLLAASLLSVAAVGSVAVATPQPVPSLQQCATLLPKGKTYTYSMTGSIDTVGARPKVSGIFSVSDGTTIDRHEEGAAFGKCIASVIRFN